MRTLIEDGSWPNAPKSIILHSYALLARIVLEGSLDGAKWRFPPRKVRLCSEESPGRGYTYGYAKIACIYAVLRNTVVGATRRERGGKVGL